MSVAEAITPTPESRPLMPGEAHSTIEPSALRPHTYTLTLKGYLTTGWTGRLASGLAQHGISIVRGEAERDAAHVWRSSLEVKAGALVHNPFGIDFVALAQKEVPRYSGSAAIELGDFLLEPPARHDGSLYLEVKAADRLGFLGDLLDYFSFKCLFPIRMSIETVGSTVCDRFWLRGVAGSVPSDSLYAGLRHDLEGLRKR